jgi:polyhydroxyalkanoate synthase
MMLAAAALMSSKSGLPIWSAGSTTSKPAPRPVWPGLPESLAPESLGAELARSDPAAFGRALDAAVIAAAGDYADGIAAYRHHSYARGDEAARPVWSRGSTVLLDHGRSSGPFGAVPGAPVIFVPSLINRGWILDLIPGHGMLSWLAGQNIRPFRIEWGPPGRAERRFDIAGYIADRLEPALDEVARITGEPPVLAGYCMGGLLALAAAVRRPHAIRALALLATPWDFHAADRPRAEALAGFHRVSGPILRHLGEMPVEMIQALFAMTDPIVALRKFRRFAGMDPDSAEARAFVALEDWLNDGVALTLPVADDALLGWYGANTTGRGVWRVGGVQIDPAAITAPALIAMPGADRIVPPASAAPLTTAIGQARRLDVPLGHIGMIVGRAAEAGLWRPLADWIAALDRRT